MSARKGRKRKIEVPREKNGQPSRRMLDKIGGTPPALVMRMRQAAARRFADPAYGTPIGRMYLEDEITSAEYEAAKRWDGVVKSFQTAIQAPTASPRSCALEGGSGGALCDPDTEAGEIEAVEHREAIKVYERAHLVLADCGAGVLRDFRRVCEGIGESPGGSESKGRVKLGLRALVQHWRLTTAEINRDK